MFENTIKEFLGKNDQDMKDEIYAYHLEFMRKISLKLTGRNDSFKKCIISVDLSTRLKSCAGEAIFSTNTIRINHKLHKENPHELWNTYGHELAHILTRFLYGKNVKGHGKEWKAISKTLGIKTESRYSNSSFTFSKN